MTFDLEADNVEQARERAANLRSRITAAATRLGIGYRQGTVMVQAQPGIPEPSPQPCEIDNPETLFDAER